MDDSVPPPPAPPLPSPPLLSPPHPSEVDPNRFSSSSLSTLTLVIVSVLASVLLTFIVRHILRLLPSSRRSFSSVAPSTLLFRSNSSAAAAVAVTSPSDLSDKKKSALIDSLPLFKLGSSLAALSKSSPDCAVCLRSFRPGEDLRLLPACCHAFHSGCVETWIRSSPSCPLCRATVTLPQPPLPSPEPPSAGPLPVKQRAEDEPRNPPLPLPLPSPPHRLTYTIEPSFDDHPPGEDIEAALLRIQRWPYAEGADDTGPSPSGDGVAPAVGGDASRGWLRDYMDRVMSSRSSSFRSTSSSFRSSGRWLHSAYEDYGSRDERYVMDLELNAWGEAEADDGGLAALYWWIAGV